MYNEWTYRERSVSEYLQFVTSDDRARISRTLVGDSTSRLCFQLELPIIGLLVEDFR